MSQTIHFEPQDEAYAQRVEDSFERQKIMKTLKATLVEVTPGTTVIQMPYRVEITQQHGFVHAGAMATILDSACGYAAYTLMAKDEAVLSIEYKINMLAPAKGKSVIARARVVRAGRTISVITR